MATDTALDALWELEGRLTDSAGEMEQEATSKSLSAPAAEKLAHRAEGIKLARQYVWDAIRERTTQRANGAAAEA
jgi:hypothetical protein